MDRPKDTDRVTCTLSSRERLLLPLIAAISLAILYLGWRQFWFLTDDAFIAFRYISNSHFGIGYVWNAPPFRPVEGYTSFLWIVVLDLVWRFAGVEPPDASNFISLVCAGLTLGIGSWWILTIVWSGRFAPYRTGFLALILLATLTNRTFLAWTSSGLETALFNLLLTSWFCLCLSLRTWDQAGSISLLSTLAALTALTRPDGLILLPATCAIAGASAIFGTQSRKQWFKLSAALLPMSAVFAHIFWRKQFYGEWLPNTYYAKVGSQSFGWHFGSLYLLSFVMEYAIWIWLILAIVISVTRLRTVWRNWHGIFVKPEVIWIAGAITVGCVVTEIAYYVIRVGGDHFEYRIFSHLILFMFASFVWMLDRMRVRPFACVLCFLLFMTASWIVPWVHWASTSKLHVYETRLRVSVAETLESGAPWLPNPVLGYARYFDELQSTLVDHWICVRQQEHRLFWEYSECLFPSREEGMQIKPDGYPVLAIGAVGYVGWALPRVNIIDILGLNDYVIARSGKGPLNMMAHDRAAPDGYVECFLPNIEINPLAEWPALVGSASREVAWKVRIANEPRELAAAQICECERKYTERLALGETDSD
jgi:arabinofuranosyltransferase